MGQHNAIVDTNGEVMMRLNREELAWAGGFFSGEGCISYTSTGKEPQRRVMLHVTNTHLPGLERFNAAVNGLLRIYKAKPHKGTKQVWRLCGTSFEACQAVITMLWPWLTPEKQERTREVLSAYHNWEGVR